MGRKWEFAVQKSCCSDSFVGKGQLTAALWTDSADRTNDRKGR